MYEVWDESENTRHTQALITHSQISLDRLSLSSGKYIIKIIAREGDIIFIDGTDEGNRGSSVRIPFEIENQGPIVTILCSVK